MIFSSLQTFSLPSGEELKGKIMTEILEVRVSYQTFVLPEFDGKELPSVGVDDEFAQETQRVNEERIFKLLPGVNTLQRS